MSIRRDEEEWRRHRRHPVLWLIKIISNNIASCQLYLITKENERAVSIILTIGVSMSLCQGTGGRQCLHWFCPFLHDFGHFSPRFCTFFADFLWVDIASGNLHPAVTSNTPMVLINSILVSNSAENEKLYLLQSLNQALQSVQMFVEMFSFCFRDSRLQIEK